MLPAPPAAINAIPLQGWPSTSGDDWWPNTGGWTLISGPGPDRAISHGGAYALAFTPDGRLALAAPNRLNLVHVDGPAPVVTHPLPATRAPPETWVFSDDGTRLCVGAASEAAWLVDVLPGRVRALTNEVAGTPKAAFTGDGPVVVIDNVSQFRADWESARSEPIDVGGPVAAHGFGAAGALVALPGQWPDVNLVDLNGGVVVRRFPQVQGLHQLSLSPGGRWLGMKGQSGLRLCDAGSGVTLWDHDGDSDLHTARSRIKWTPDGRRGAAAGNEFAYVWSVAERWVARFPHGRVRGRVDVALSADGRRMAASAAGSSAVAYWSDVDAATRPAAVTTAPDSRN